MRKLLFAIIILAAINLTAQDKVTGDISPIFALSPDNKTIAFSAGNGQSSFLFEYSFKDKSITPLAGLGDDYFIRPSFSSNGKMLLYLSKTAAGKNIFLMDLNTGKAISITKGDFYVTEAIFSKAGDKIIFCAAQFVGNYSPLGRKAPHDLDLFSINPDGTGLKKLTNFKAYSLNSISTDKSGDSVLCALNAGDREGIYLVPLKDTGTLRKIETVNNPRPEIGADFYETPNYSADGKTITFMAPYQLLLMDMATLKCSELWTTLAKDDMAMPMCSSFFNTGDKILFSTLAIKDRHYATDASFYQLDIKTKGLTELKLK